MSVDTYLKRKNLAPYSAIQHEGVKIMVATSLVQWAQAVQIGVRQGWFSKSFDVEAIPSHEHGPSCQH